jgi:hypothetical protein
MSADDADANVPQEDEVDYEEEGDEDDIVVPEYTTDANPRHRGRALSPPAVQAPVAPVQPVQPLSNRQRRRQRKAQTEQRASVRSRLGGKGPSALQGRPGPLEGTSIAVGGRVGPLGCTPGHFASQCPNRAPPGPPPGPPAAAPFGVGTDRASIIQSLHHLLSLGYALGQPETTPPRFHTGKYRISELTQPVTHFAFAKTLHVSADRFPCLLHFPAKSLSERSLASDLHSGIVLSAVTLTAVCRLNKGVFSGLRLPLFVCWQSATLTCRPRAKAFASIRALASLFPPRKR